MTTNKPDPDATSRSGSSPEEVASYVRYALGQLSGVNGHHEFEHLCRHLTRRRIYSNVLPSTGPVAAGGDQGADFETYSVGKPLGEASDFFARATHLKALCACSIQKNYAKKIKDDLKAAAAFHDPVERLVFFSNTPIPIGQRHKLQALARQKYKIGLEVFDVHAIAEFLADPELFWVAQRYLSIPSELALAGPKASTDWYREALATNPDPAHLAASDFFELRDAVRFATFKKECHSDLPILLAKIRLFRKHFLPRIGRKAFYEEFVASLRGLEVAEEYKSDLAEYFKAIPDLEDPAELEDAAVLVNYAMGARVRGLLQIDVTVIAEWRTLLLSRIERLLAKGPSAGRYCALLDVKGFLMLSSWMTGTIPPASAGHAAVVAAAADAVPIWRRMIRKARNAPMFPLERFAHRLSQQVAIFGNAKHLDLLIKETDELLSKRVGKHKLADQAFERAAAYYEAGQILRAVEELHKAHFAFFTNETASKSVGVCLFLAKLYAEMGLYFAAKFYALAASFASLKLDDDRLRARCYRGLAEAASCDHATGASMSFFLAAEAFHFITYEFSAAGSEKTREFEWGRINFYTLQLTYAASYISKQLHEHLRDSVLPRYGQTDAYNETLPQIREFFSEYPTYREYAGAAIEQGIAAPFSDVGKVRKAAWRQLEIDWYVEWPTEYQINRTAEQFVSLLQICLGDFCHTELSLLPGTVSLSLEIHDGKLTVEEVPDNHRVVRRILLPKPTLDQVGVDPGLVLSIAITVLKMVSALPHSRFASLYETRLKEGLSQKVSPYASYDIVHREFYSEERFAELYSMTQEIQLDAPRTPIKTHPDLAAPHGEHPDYDTKEAEQVIRNRYRVLPAKLKYSLPKLLREPRFVDVVRQLRSRGWKDWHILLALANLRSSNLLNLWLPGDASPEEIRKFSTKMATSDESESDPPLTVQHISLEKLEFALEISQLSTLTNMGFHCWQRTPNFSAVDAFLRRFHYWDDDVSHEDPFPVPSTPAAGSG